MRREMVKPTEILVSIRPPASLRYKSFLRTVIRHVIVLPVRIIPVLVVRGSSVPRCIRKPRRGPFVGGR